MNNLIHYSKQPRETLSTKFHGTGIPDAAARRIQNDGLTKTPIAHRIYFYIQRPGTDLPNPEVGVGTHVHRVPNPESLNLYDGSSSEEFTKLKQHYRKELGVSEGSAAELALVELGYDGYVSPSQGMAVVLGNDVTVPVEYLGQYRDLRKNQG